MKGPLLLAVLGPRPHEQPLAMHSDVIMLQEGSFLEQNFRDNRVIMDIMCLSFMRKEWRRMGEMTGGWGNVGLGEKRARTKKENWKRHCDNILSANSFSTCLEYFLGV